MHRACSVNGAGLDARSLPPVLCDGRLRLLTIVNEVLGWSTYAGALESYTRDRDDVDAVHVRLRARRADQVQDRLRGLAGRRGDPHAAHVLRLRRRLHRLFDGPLDLSRFDVVHIAPQLPALAVAERPGAPALSVALDSTVAQAKSQRIGESTDESNAPPELARVESLVLARAALVAPFSRWAAADVLARHAGRLTGDVEVFLPAIPDPGPPARRDTGSLARIAFVGNDWRRKGGERLLRWHQERWTERAELHVCSRSAPRIDAREVRFHGAVPNQRLLRELLPSMHLLVLPTTADQSSWASVEAAACGVPVVVSRVGGIADIVVDGVTGVLVDPADDAGFVAAVDALLDDPGRRSAMGAAAREHFEQALDGRVVGARLLDRLVEIGHDASHSDRPSPA